MAQQNTCSSLGALPGSEIRRLNGVSCKNNKKKIKIENKHKYFSQRSIEAAKHVTSSIVSSSAVET